jgi:steroid 5-alpha reductase family enzyme
LPTVVVYLACLSLYGVLGPARQPAVGARPLGVLDLLALLVTGAAIYTEARADGELWRFLGARKRGDLPPDAVLEMGLRSYARYPNYLGEMGFWWGLYLFALAAAPHLWWTIVGPLAVTALFVTISIPMMERRMRDRRAQRGTAV